MTWGEAAQVITAASAFGAFLLSAAAFVVGLWNGRKIEVVRHATNSMKDEIVTITAKASKAEGVLEEKERNQTT